MKLIVLNLPRSLAEPELADLFRAQGPVTACSLVLDGQSGTSKGFGFVEMEHEADALAALENLHGSKVGKNRIRVKPAP